MQAKYGVNNIKLGKYAPLIIRSPKIYLVHVCQELGCKLWGVATTLKFSVPNWHAAKKSLSRLYLVCSIAMFRIMHGLFLFLIILIVIMMFKESLVFQIHIHLFVLLLVFVIITTNYVPRTIRLWNSLPTSLNNQHCHFLHILVSI